MNVLRSFEMELLNKDTFKSAIENGIVVVDFFAEWCSPCKQLAPFLNKKEEEFPSVKFFKVDTDENDSLTSLYQIRSLPTVIIFKNGKEEERIVGFSSAVIDNSIRKVLA